MAHSAFQTTLYTFSFTFRSTISGCSKCRTFNVRAIDPRSPVVARYISFCGPKFNLHSARIQGELFTSFNFPSFSKFLVQLRSSVNAKLTVLSVLFAKQFNAIAAQRIRRAAQIINLYNNLGYDRRMVRSIVEKIGGALPKELTNRPIGLLLGAAFFSWDKARISDEELASVADEISHVHRSKTGDYKGVDGRFTDWEKIIDKGFLTLWRKPMPNSYLYEYKVYGTYHDLPARAFFAVQLDLEFRCQWDKLVISLDVIDKDDEPGSEVVHWITHYPYPMYSREYVYVRKYKVDYDKKLMVIVNRSIDHPSRPVNSNKYVRVDTYMSKMVIKPHVSFDDNGFDYVLTYYDDPKAAFPSVAYSWMANTGVPDFVDKLHTAAMRLHERKKSAGHGKGEEEEEPDQIPDEDRRRIPM